MFCRCAVADLKRYLGRSFHSQVPLALRVVREGGNGGGGGVAASSPRSPACALGQFPTGPGLFCSPVRSWLGYRSGLGCGLVR